MLQSKRGGLNMGVDILGWVSNEKNENLISAISGFDKRRIDYDFYSLIDKIKMLN
ncbi:hypothetical protein [Chryseobacterium proteolyticum]|uniref:hypothetical protein n=1 Tax=Chryseobacterium proteolyticum TaxID=118127 RepID=UPI003983026D